jgi:hypothetical protein
VNGWRERQAKDRRDAMPVDMPPRVLRDYGRAESEGEPRFEARPAPRTPLPRLVVRIAVGSVGLALAAGVVVGWMTDASAGGAPGDGPAEVRIRGAGHLGAPSNAAAFEPGGPLADAAAMRERLLATGIPRQVSVERLLSGSVLVDVEEKRAVALLDWEPPVAVAEDGTVLGPATVADFAWADAADLVLVRGAERSDADFAVRASLAGRLAAALLGRPELDRLVSELDVSGGPYRVQVILRSPSLPVLLSERDFLGGLERVVGFLPDLVEHWPGLTRVDARVRDRFLVRSEPAEATEEVPAHPGGGAAE